uniref:Uncharacterized protein n=1 Tax=Heterorhabditis bacteriophora TaxID=37862 RepID=A0A1I7WI65_HETBA
MKSTSQPKAYQKFHILFVVVSIPNILTEWEDEDVMRQRIANYSKEKFSHKYHHWEKGRCDPLESVRLAEIPRKGRVKRDGGFVSGPIATAVVTGMIGR